MLLMVIDVSSGIKQVKVEEGKTPPLHFFIPDEVISCQEK